MTFFFISIYKMEDKDITAWWACRLLEITVDRFNHTPFIILWALFVFGAYCSDTGLRQVIKPVEFQEIGNETIRSIWGRLRKNKDYNIENLRTILHPPRLESGKSTTDVSDIWSGVFDY